MPEAVIVSAARSPIGRANKGSLKDLRPDDLTATIIQAALDKIPGLDPSIIDDHYLGCGLPGGESGNNMARIVNVLMGLDSVPGATITRYCSSSVQVGNRAFKNYESGAYGYIGFDKALEVSCNTFFYRIGLDYWQRFGSDVADVEARDPLVEEAEKWGFGAETGIDLPGEAAGRIADREWKRDYFESQKDYYCDIADKPRDAPGNRDLSDFVYTFAGEFCVEGYAYRAGDAVNFAIGQGDTIVTPLQLARGYAAIANGGTLYEPRIGAAIVATDGTVIRRIEPEVSGHVDLPPGVDAYIDGALQGVTRQGTMSWRMGGFPLDEVSIRSKTGSAEVYGKQSTSWVASYSDDYVVVMMISQGGTGSGSSGPGVRAIWEALYGIEGEEVDPSQAAIPGTTLPKRLPVFQRNGSILPPQVRGSGKARS